MVQFNQLMAMADVVSEEYLQPDSPTHLSGRIAMESLSPSDLDSLPFGVIKLDREGKILHYNDYESQLAGVDKAKALGKNFFTELAPCTDVQAFHGRFKDGVAKAELYVTFRYHFSFKKNPRDVTVTLFYSKITGSTWVFIRPE
jgi:photoactive yellow protein